MSFLSCLNRHIRGAKHAQQPHTIVDSRPGAGMSCWALIPLKTPGLGKTRLSRELGAREREELITAMLGRVVDALMDSREVEHVAMVGGVPSHCPDGVRHLLDSGQGLNEALSTANSELQLLGAKELLVLHADLPLACGMEIDQFVRSGRCRQIALASDRHKRGTNAVFLSQPSRFAFAFGTDSFARHLACAEAQHIRPALSESPGLMLDVDTADDLRMVNNLLTPFASYRTTSQRRLSYA